MNTAPNSWTCKSLIYHFDNGYQTEHNGKWFPARPVGLFSLINRSKLAWAVFMGHADALY